MSTVSSATSSGYLFCGNQISLEQKVDSLIQNNEFESFSKLTNECEFELETKRNIISKICNQKPEWIKFILNKWPGIINADIIYQNFRANNELFKLILSHYNPEDIKTLANKLVKADLHENNFQTMLSSSSMRPFLRDAINDIPQLRNDLLIFLIYKKKYSEFNQLFNELKLKSEDQRTFFKDVWLDDEWIIFLLENRYESLINIHILKRAVYFLPKEYYKLICDLLNPTKDEFISILIDRTSYGNQENLHLLLMSQSNKPFFQEIINDPKITPLLLNNEWPIEFYITLNSFGLKNKWFSDRIESLIQNDDYETFKLYINTFELNIEEKRNLYKKISPQKTEWIQFLLEKWDGLINNEIILKSLDIHETNFNTIISYYNPTNEEFKSFVQLLFQKHRYYLFYNRNVETLFSDNKIKPLLQDAINEIPTFRNYILETLISKNQFTEFLTRFKQLNLSIEAQQDFFEIAHLNKEWIVFLLENEINSFINKDTIIRAISFRTNEFKLICEKLNPSRNDFKYLLQETLTRHYDKKYFQILLLSQSSQPFFHEILNDPEIVLQILETKFPIEFYIRLYNLGLESRWFNEPLKDNQTIMHRLIRQGETQLMQNLLKDIPPDELYLGDYFTLEDFEECRGSSASTSSSYSIIAQRGCSTIVQDENGNTQTLPGINARELWNQTNRTDPGALKLYINRNHGSISVRHPNQTTVLHRGMYPSEQPFLTPVNCSVNMDITNAEASDSTNELTLEILIDEKQASNIQSYVESIESDCSSKKQKYHPLFFNCLHIPQKAAEKAGFHGSIGHAFRPDQLIRRIEPLPNHHSKAAQYTLAYNYGITTLALAQISAPLAAGYGAISSTVSPTAMDLIIGGISCYCIYRIGKSCISAMASYLYPPPPPAPPSQEKLALAQEAFDALKAKVNDCQQAIFQKRQERTAEELEIDDPVMDEWGDLQDEFEALSKAFAKPKNRDTAEAISTMIDEIQGFSKKIDETFN